MKSHFKYTSTILELKDIPWQYFLTHNIQSTLTPGGKAALQYSY